MGRENRSPLHKRPKMAYNRGMSPGPPAPTGNSSIHPISPAIHWILRIGIYMCFLGHGSFGIITKDEWLPYFGVVGIGRDASFSLMPWIGLHDLTLAAIGLVSPRPVVLLWMTIWCAWTAALRPMAGQGMWEFWERAGNYGVPLAFLVLAGWPRSWREWLAPIRPKPVSAETLRAFGLTLRWTIAMLLIGHAGFGVFQHKEGLAHLYAQAGLPAVAFAGIPLPDAIGWFELALAAAILVKPFAPLLFFICIYKIASELLYPATGHRWWEFIERGGDYTAPVTLYLAGRAKQAVQAPARPAPAYGTAALLLGLLFAGIVCPHTARAQRERAAPGRIALTMADTARVALDFSAPSDTALVRMLRAGGFILAFRHGATNWNERDRGVLDYSDRSGQRNLSARGRALMTNAGKAIAAMGIPIGHVRASPLWRCRDTATLAFDRCDTTSALFLKGREHRRARWTLMSTPTPKGTDDVIVTHQDALMPLTTLKRDELGEGDALVVEPLGLERGFRVVAQLAPTDWLRLAAAAGVEVKGRVPVPGDVDSTAAPAGSMVHPPGSMVAPSDSTEGSE
jgi:Histidine phosphatase superfamily (branch 1)